ncbi:MAG TPA: cell division protein SepF, partial [Candidatus Avamphibacillus intestinigallinarum]|nr:cell division protein SepF [Candidatus Avamphibacillus intestinigallinarum]
MSFKTKFKSFFTVDDEYEYIEAPEQEQEFSKETKEPVVQNRKSAENVVNLTAISQSNSKVVLCEPRSYNEAQDIADHIMNRRAVVINLQLLDYDKSLRVIDFLSGTVYALNGDIQKLGD